MKQTCFMSKVTSVPQTKHSQYSLIIESKSLPVELNNSTIEVHVPPRQKKSLRSYYSVEMRFDMTFDATLCDGSSLGKLTNSCF